MARGEAPVHQEERSAWMMYRGGAPWGTGRDEAPVHKEQKSACGFSFHDVSW